jgi:hypothetical protein
VTDVGIIGARRLGRQQQEIHHPLAGVNLIRL